MPEMQCFAGDSKHDCDLPPTWWIPGYVKCPSLKLSWRSVAEGRVAPLPIIEHLNILEDVPCRLPPRHVLPMVHELVVLP